MHKPAAEEEITSLHDLSATDLIAGYRAKQFSPSEVLEEVIDACRGVGAAHQGALSVRSRQRARCRKGIDRSLAAGASPTGTLDGVPVTIKDNIATKGQPIPLGAASVKLIPAEKDAPPAARLREFGAIIFAKTTMTDYGMLSSGLSSFHALTRNPWDVSKNPGGSSSGAGAAGAAGYGPLHLGTDIGGSVRLPACVVRPGRAEAEFWARSVRSALCRPRRRSDDPHRRRCGADDVRAVEAGPPRRHEPAGRQQHSTGRHSTSRRASCASA